MIFHRFLIRLRIVQHSAVRADPGNADFIGGQIGKIRVSLVRDALRDERGLLLQRAHLYVCEMHVQHAENQYQRRQQNRRSDDQKRTKNALRHGLTSNR